MMTIAKRLTTRMATTEFALESIPEVDEAEMRLITERITGTTFDMGSIHTLLFGTPHNYSNEQMWALSTTIVLHALADKEDIEISTSD
jgi:hypothetical protein